MSAHNPGGMAVGPLILPWGKRRMTKTEWEEHLLRDVRQAQRIVRRLPRAGNGDMKMFWGEIKLLSQLLDKVEEKVLTTPVPDGSE